MDHFTKIVLALCSYFLLVACSPPDSTPKNLLSDQKAVLDQSKTIEKTVFAQKAALDKQIEQETK